MYPELLKFKRTDFHLADGIVNAGYECMKKNLLEWLLQPEALYRRPDLAGILQENVNDKIVGAIPLTIPVLGLPRPGKNAVLP